VTHSIEIWQAMPGPADHLPPFAASDSELPTPEEGDEAVIELLRQYPSLSREMAEYLAR